MAPARWTSNLAAFRARHARAVDAGLINAAEKVKSAVKRGLRGGYTSGDFATGLSVNSVTRSNPEDEFGVRTIRVGTGLLYNLFWELGHRNRWTGKFERKEVWRPALEESREAAGAAFARVYARTMGGPGAAPTGDGA